MAGNSNNNNKNISPHPLKFKRELITLLADNKCTEDVLESLVEKGVVTTSEIISYALELLGEEYTNPEYNADYDPEYNSGYDPEDDFCNSENEHFLVNKYMRLRSNAEHTYVYSMREAQRYADVYHELHQLSSDATDEQE